MKKILTLCLLFCFTFGAKAQLLWKISNNGLAQPSFIVGTHHLSPLSIKDSIPNLQKALNDVEQVYGEVIINEMRSIATIQKIQKTIVLPGDTTLHTLLSPSEYDSAAVKIKELMGVDLKMMDKLKPAFITIQLTALLAMKSIKGFNPQQQLDDWFQKEALSKGKKYKGLETIDMQINILFNSQSLKRQAEQFYATLINIKKTEGLTRKMIDAYMHQDLKALEQIVDTKLGNACDALPEEREMLIYKRNKNWVKKMPDIMKAHPTLFAVGAAHLIGEEGVLALLKEKGYTIEPF